MISVSSAFLNMMQVRTNFERSAVVTLADQTTLRLTNNDFTISGNTLTDAAGGGALPVGTAISRTVHLELTNENGRFNTVSFVDAEVVLTLSYNTGSSTESFVLGTFTVKQPATYGSTVVLDAMDDMYKADHLFETALTYPATAFELFSEICTNTGIQTDAQSIPQGEATISQAPSSQLTYRQVLGYIAMLSGGNARISRGRKLEIINYDFSGLGTVSGSATFTEVNGNVTGEGTFTVTDDGNGNLTVQLAATDSGSGDVTISGGGSATYHELNLWKNLSSDLEDITITGISTTAETSNGGFDIVTVGQEGNVLTISNPLIAGREQAALTAMWSYLSGATYRPFSGEHVAYPLAEFGDLCHVSDGLGRSFWSVITDMVFTFNGLTTFTASAEAKESTGGGTLSQNITRISADVADIKRLKVGWADIDTAVINTLEAEGINANDVSVSGTLHSSDYVRTTSVYADVGLGIELDNKRIAATGFAVTPTGALYAKQGLIADAHLSASTAHYYAAPPSAFLDVDGNPGAYTYDAALTENKLTAGEAGTAIYSVAKTALDGTGLNKVWCQCKSGGNDDESRPTPLGTVKYLDSNSTVLFESAYSGLRYVDASSTQGTTFTLNPTYLSQCASIRVEIKLADGDTCKLQRWYGIYAAIYYGSSSSASALKGSADGVYFGSDGISVGEDICLTPDGHLNAGVLTTSGDVLINDSDSIIRKPEMDVTATSVPAEQVASFAVLDKNNVFVSWFDTYQSTNGRLRLALVVRGKASGSVSNGIYLDVYSDGTRGVSVSSPAAWRSALGVSAIQSKTVSGTTDANGFITLSLANGSYIPLVARSSHSDDHVEFTTGSTSWWGRVTNRGAARGNASVTIDVYYTDKP